MDDANSSTPSTHNPSLLSYLKLNKEVRGVPTPFADSYMWALTTEPSIIGQHSTRHAVLRNIRAIRSNEICRALNVTSLKSTIGTSDNWYMHTIAEGTNGPPGHSA